MLCARISRATIAGGVCFVLLAPQAQAAKRILYSFSGGADGSYPESGLIEDGGDFYGTNSGGGSAGMGVVFKVTKAGVETVLHSFAGGTDGAAPQGKLIKVGDAFYGTTIYGGTVCAAPGCGTVFRMTKDGAVTVLHSFGSGEDGVGPRSGLVSIGDALYSTTTIGGASGAGTVFKVTRKGQETVVYSFKGGPILNNGDGAAPFAGLIDFNGVLYGTTAYGGLPGCGIYGCGTVFRVTLKGVETVLHSFQTGSDGTTPYAGLVSAGGRFYGSTSEGGTAGLGTEFKVTRKGVETILHSFAGPPDDGTSPEGDLIKVNGTLYGVTNNGGTSNVGTVFKMNKAGVVKVIYSFMDNTDGSNPDASLVEVNGKLYGTTDTGGTYGYGTVFEITP